MGKYRLLGFSPSLLQEEWGHGTYAFDECSRVIILRKMEKHRTPAPVLDSLVRCPFERYGDTLIILQNLVLESSSLSLHEHLSVELEVRN